MGRDWFNKLKVHSGQVNLLDHDQLKEVLTRHEEVFDETL